MIDVNELRINLGTFTLGPISLQIKTGAFFTLMGPTGSGKTLLLESLAGLLQADSGSISIDQYNITNASPEQRNIGLVYQDNCLFPHLSVFENIIYGQRYNGIDKRKGRNYACELMEMLSITPLKERKPSKLSGGEKQRVSLARALACRPKIVLLDEPLSSLDPQFREGLRKNLKELHQNSGTTFFMVTHDFVDALTLADSAAVIHKGCIEQCGSTLDIFHRPATAFIADFVGMKNIFPSRYENQTCTFSGLQIPVHDLIKNKSRGYAALRPEDIHIGPESDEEHEAIVLKGTVTTLSRDGFTWIAVIRCNGADFTARLEPRQAIHGKVKEGDRITFSFHPASLHHMYDD